MPGLVSSLRLIDGDQLLRLVSLREAIDAIASVVRGGFDPSDDPARSIVDVPTGQLLLMPSALRGVVGQKLATVSPDVPGRTVPRIQALYVVIDAATLTPVAVLDGTALTTLRTPAVSAAAADVLADPDAATAVIFGTGPQGVAHVGALAAIRPIQHVRMIGRDPVRTRRACAAARELAPDADIVPGTIDDLAGSDLIVCATTAGEPLFEAASVGDQATVIAVGSHDPARRELPAALLGRAQVVVETAHIARTEAGDVILAVADGALATDEVVEFREVFAEGFVAARDRPRVIKTCGMGWQDLAVARLVMDRL